MQIIQQFTTKNQTYTNPKKITVKGIVLHSTGCAQPKASVYINSFNSPKVQKSVHAFLQEDGMVYQTLPWDYKAWHVGSGNNGSYNSDHIGIEMCEPGTIKYTGGASWTDLNPDATRKSVYALYNVAVELFASLCKTYNLNPLADGVIVSHYEAHQRGKGSGHVYPKHLWDKFGLTMNQFRSDVAAKIGGASSVPATPTHTQTQPTQPTQPTTPTAPVVDNTKHLGQVKVEPGDSLNVRNMPNGSVIGKLGNKFIVGVESVDANGWAKLTAGGYAYNKYLATYRDGYATIITNFTVLIKADVVNVRKTPDESTGNNITGHATKGQVLTIVATTHDCKFGLLKSGAGYLPLYNTDMVEKRS